MSTPDPSELAALYRIASLATRAPSALAAQDEVLAAILAAFPADSGSLSLINPDNGRLEICIQQGLPPDVGEFALRPGQGITGWVALHGRPMLVTDVANEPRYIAARQGVHSEMAAPLIVEGQTVGVVNLDADRLAAFNQQDLARLARLAAEAGAVLHRLWQLERLRTNSARLTTLVELGHALVGELASEELLATLTESGRVLFSADLCLLHDYDRTTDELRLKAWSAGGERSAAILALQGQTVPANDSLLAAVVHAGRSMEFQHIDGPGYREAADLPSNVGLTSALGTPLRLEGTSSGVLSVFHATPHRYNDDEKRLLAALASFAAVSLQNARLYARVFQSEDTLRKNETLTTLGMLAAEIAHEIRNPLTVIKLLHGSLGVDFAPDDPRRRDLQVITEKIEQLEAIVSRVLSFGRNPQTLHSRWSLAEIIDDTLVLLRAKLEQANVEIHYTAPDRDLIVDVHKGQVQQVILNLAINSLHAMPHGGELTLRGTAAQQDGLPVVHLDVTDTGTGIPSTIQPRMFESFLSGRADGTGLGLAIAQRIMKDHHGSLSLVETSPRGTTMRMTLPRLTG
jgi:signal transduction histidine kinase